MYFSVGWKGNLTSAQLERNKTKEQLEEEKKISLSIRIKPLEIDNFSIEKLRSKANELWDTIVKLETEKYDLEERQKRQDYDVSENTLQVNAQSGQPRLGGDFTRKSLSKSLPSFSRITSTWPRVVGHTVHVYFYIYERRNVSNNCPVSLQLKELKERQKQQLRHKALKKGLDPEALTGKYPVSGTIKQ